MEYPGFKENACLANDEYFTDKYGSQAYFVNKEWLNNIDKTNIVNVELPKALITQIKTLSESFDDEEENCFEEAAELINILGKQLTNYNINLNL